MEIIEVLRRNPHLSSLPAGDLEALAAAFVPASYPAGHVVFAQGDRGHTIHLVLSGEVRVILQGGGGEREIRRLHPGELFGLRAVLQHSTRSATCTTAVPSELAELPNQGVMLLFNRSAPVAYAFQKALARQLARDQRACDQRLREVLARAPR